MRAIPYVFHVGPLQIHTYGIGLALTFLIGIWYLTRRFRRAGEPWAWIGQAALPIIAAAILGARLVHVIANAGYYASHPLEIPAIWLGGLSSFGGLLLGVPVGLHLARKNCPGLGTARALDLAAPVFAAGWAIGRLLGPQVMFRGGGRVTDAWYGMYYWGEPGRRIPAPIFQSIECWTILAAVLLVEKMVLRRPDGVLIATAALAWGIARFTDQYFWLGTPGRWDPVETAGLLLALAGAGGLVWVLRRRGPQRAEA